MLRAEKWKMLKKCKISAAAADACSCFCCCCTALLLQLAARILAWDIRLARLWNEFGTFFEWKHLWLLPPTMQQQTACNPRNIINCCVWCTRGMHEIWICRALFQHFQAYKPWSITAKFSWRHTFISCTTIALEVTEYKPRSWFLQGPFLSITFTLNYVQFAPKDSCTLHY